MDAAMLNKWSHWIKSSFTLQKEKPGHLVVALWRFKTSLLGSSQRTDLPLAKANTQDGTQAAQLYRKEETACSSNWTGGYESYMFTVWEQNSSATGFELCEVTGRGWIIWIRRCFLKNNKTRYPDVRAPLASFFFLTISSLIPCSSLKGVTPQLHTQTVTLTHMQTNTGSYSKSRESALYLRRAVRVNLKPYNRMVQAAATETQRSQTKGSRGGGGGGLKGLFHK